MKWFKHHSNANRDEKLSRLVDEFGLEGYGLYWLIVESIAEQFDDKNKTFLEYSERNWRKISGFSAKKFQKFLEIVQKTEIFLVKIEDDVIRIDCPKLLKIQDNYSSRGYEKDTDNYVVTTDKIPNKEEIEKEYIKDNVENDVQESFDELWAKYPRKVAKQQAFKTFKKLKPDRELLEKIIADVRVRVETEWVDGKNQFIPHLGTYLNGARWEDESPAKRLRVVGGKSCVPPGCENWI